jgi:hypothetical protein
VQLGVNFAFAAVKVEVRVERHFLFFRLFFNLEGCGIAGFQPVWDELVLAALTALGLFLGGDLKLLLRVFIVEWVINNLIDVLQIVDGGFLGKLGRVVYRKLRPDEGSQNWLGQASAQKRLPGCGFLLICYGRLACLSIGRVEPIVRF